METTETVKTNAAQGMEDNDVLKQFAELLNRQDMKGQSQDFMEILQYVAGMQRQLGTMLDELQGVRQELAQMQESQPKTAMAGLMDRIAHLQEKVTSLSERLSAVRDHLVETAAQALNAFKEKGRAEMCRVIQKGISGVKSMFADYRERLVDVMTDYQKTADQIDSIGDEIKQAGNSIANVGRLLTGKGVKEASSEKPGVGLTRVINAPFKKAVENLQKNVDKVDKAMEKLDWLSDRFAVEKETEKSGRASIKDKLAKMQERTGQQKKAPEQDKAKEKAECL